MEDIFITPGIKLISQEREKQIKNHGFTGMDQANHPKYYDRGQLQDAAYKLLSLDLESKGWPVAPLNWDAKWFQKLCEKSRNDRMKIAGALLAAELDRLDVLSNREDGK